ncbi:par-1 [Symbiodinium pilosum]|uniref:Par-1 protein n=1 Tax=Symbiodinium pilosum TaxID=2952 RepID=A0A812VGV0_SYMPI|nr:par-1 [Symbiodinium pilosum]
MTDGSPKTNRSLHSVRTKDLGFFPSSGDGTQSATMTRHVSSVSTCDSLTKVPSPVPSPALERKNSKSSLGGLPDARPEKPADSDRKEKSVALMLAKCMQSSLKLPGTDSPCKEPPSPDAGRSPLSAASGLVLSPKPQTAKSRRDSETQPLLLPNEFKSRLLQRQGTSPPSLGSIRRGFDSPVSRSPTPMPSFHPEKDLRMMDEKEKIFDLYLWNEVLQEEGDGGKVVVCEPKPIHSDVPFRTYVMKMRSKKSLREASMEEQFRKSLFNLLNLPEHVGVLPLQEVLEDNQFYYIVMEQATGGSFFGGLLKEFEDGVMPPQEVRRLMRGILEAIGHVHEQGMIHRDLKPDNLVMRLCDDDMSPTGKSRQVAIIDFDHADPDYKASAKTPRSCEYFCGTVYFSAPEAFLGYFSPASDLYSIGIILYLLMAGKMPFDNALFQEEMSVLQQSPKSRGWTMNVYRRLKAEPIDWRCDPWPKQPLCCSFCQWLLAFEPGKRPSSAEEALQHEWFVDD